MMFEPAPAAVFRPLDEDGVILNTENGSYFQVNPSGRLLWESLQGGAERETLVGALIEQFDLDAATAASDVDDFLSALEERGLVRATN